jgi:hypothetical protein
VPIVRTPSAEGELGRKRALLASLGSERAELELELATLKAELAQFDLLCRFRLAERYAQLDELRARLAEVRANKTPERPAARAEAEQAREKAQQSASEVPHEEEPEPPRTRFSPSEDLKALYRKVVRLVHPDLARSQTDARRRHELMVAANEAYAAGNEDRLREILAGASELAPIPPSADIDAALAEVLCSIEDVRKRIATIESELADLRRSDLCAFMLRAREAEEEGRDLLAEVAADLDLEIEEARRPLREEEAG